MGSFFATSRDVLSSAVDAYRRRLDQNPGNVEMQKTMEFYEAVRNEESLPSSRRADLENDLRRSAEISAKCKGSESYAQNLYAALCNNSFHKGGRTWACSWRQSAGVVAHMVERGDYVDWYCSGVSGGAGVVSEGVVTDEVRSDLLSVGWRAD